MRKGWEQHANEVIGGGELLRVTIWAVFFYRTAHQIGVYQRNQLSENGLAKKEATFIHVIDFLQNQITLKRDDLKRKSRF